MRWLKNGMCSFAFMLMAQAGSAEIIIYDFTANAEGRALTGTITVDTELPMDSDEHHVYASNQIIDASLYVDGEAVGDYAWAHLSHYFPEGMEEALLASNLAIYFSPHPIFGEVLFRSYYEYMDTATYGLDAASFLDEAGLLFSSLVLSGREIYVDSETIARRPPVSVPEPSLFLLSMLALLPLCIRARPEAMSRRGAACHSPG